MGDGKIGREVGPSRWLWMYASRINCLSPRSQLLYEITMPSSRRRISGPAEGIGDLRRKGGHFVGRGQYRVRRRDWTLVTMDDRPD